MRLSSVILLAVLCFSLMSPLAIHLASAGQEEQLVTLDVCHTADASLSVNADSPVLYECLCKLLTLEFAGFYEPGSVVFTAYLSSRQEERPPRI